MNPSRLNVRVSQDFTAKIHQEIEVCAGDRLKVIDYSNEYLLVKKNDSYGLLPNNLAKAENFKVISKYTYSPEDPTVLPQTVSFH